MFLLYQYDAITCVRVRPKSFFDAGVTRTW